MWNNPIESGAIIPRARYLGQWARHGIATVEFCSGSHGS